MIKKFILAILLALLNFTIFATEIHYQASTDTYTQEDNITPFTGNEKCNFIYNNLASTYEGDFKNGFYCGFGTYFFNNRDKYVGQFENNRFQGQGRFSYE